MTNKDETTALPEQDPVDRARVLALLRQYGENSASYLALEKDKLWFFSSAVDGVAAYALTKRDMVVCGDPICAREDLPVFLRELRRFAKQRRLRLIFLFTLAENLPAYQRAGFGWYKSGEEAVFDLETYTMKGKRPSNARALVHQARREGLTVFEYDPDAKKDPDIEAQFDEITEQWLEAKHTSLLQFALGGIGFDEENDKRYFYAADDTGRIHGFMVFLPYKQGRGYMVDVMRRRPGCAHGTMEIIFHDAFEKLRDEGVRWGSLGIAPMANTVTEDRHTIFERLERYNFEKMNDIYGFQPLWFAKEKYGPDWEPVYLICRPKHMRLSMGYSAVSVLDTKGFSDYVNSFFDARRRKKEAERDQ